MLLDQMEIQDVLVRVEKQVRIPPSLEMMGTMAAWGVLETRAKLVFQGPVG